MSDESSRAVLEVSEADDVSSFDKGGLEELIATISASEDINQVILKTVYLVPWLYDIGLKYNRRL